MSKRKPDRWRERRDIDAEREVLRLIESVEKMQPWMMAGTPPRGHAS